MGKVRPAVREDIVLGHAGHASGQLRFRQGRIPDRYAERLCKGPQETSAGRTWHVARLGGLPSTRLGVPMAVAAGHLRQSFHRQPSLFFLDQRAMLRGTEFLLCQAFQQRETLSAVTAAGIQSRLTPSSMLGSMSRRSYA
jgi:hypothetical protein